MLVISSLKVTSSVPSSMRSRALLRRSSEAACLSLLNERRAREDVAIIVFDRPFCLLMMIPRVGISYVNIHTIYFCRSRTFPSTDFLPSTTTGRRCIFRIVPNLNTLNIHNRWPLALPQDQEIKVPHDPLRRVPSHSTTTANVPPQCGSTWTV